jgi:hypothetical protein
MSSGEASPRPPPLFSTPGSVYRRRASLAEVAIEHPADEEEEEEWTVEFSIPSTQVDAHNEQLVTSMNGRNSLPSGIEVNEHAKVKPMIPEDGQVPEAPQVKEEVDELREVTEDELREALGGSSAGFGFGSGTQTPKDDRQCRICFGGPEDEAQLGRLISPCLCSGSMRVSVSVSCTE